MAEFISANTSQIVWYDLGNIDCRPTGHIRSLGVNKDYIEIGYTSNTITHRPVTTRSLFHNVPQNTTKSRNVMY